MARRYCRAMIVICLWIGCDDPAGRTGDGDGAGALDGDVLDGRITETAVGPDAKGTILDGVGPTVDAVHGDAAPGCVVQPPTFADNKQPQQVIHVQGGAAPGGDGSKSKPFGDLAQASAAAKPGTEIQVSGEVVSNAGITVNGTASAPIWISGLAGARLRGGSAPALRLTKSSYLVVQDLELLDSPNHVLHFDYSHHLLFRRLHVHRATTACLKGSQSEFVYVEGCDFHGAGEIPGGNPASIQVFDWVGVNTGHILGSELHDGPGVMVMLKGGTSDVLFAFNEIYDQTAGGGAALHLGQSTGPQYFQPATADYEAKRLVAFANYIHDVAGPFFAFQGADSCAGVHNTMVGSTGGQLVRYLPGNAGSQSGTTTSLSRHCRFTGNIVVGGTSSGASLNADATSIGPGNALDHNIWLKPGSLNWWSPLEQEKATSVYDKDPKVSTSGAPGDTALVKGKGATDLGSLPFASAFVRDLNGICVTQPLDIGAVAVP